MFLEILYCYPTGDGGSIIRNRFLKTNARDPCRKA